MKDNLKDMTMKKIKYVQLEPAAALLDFHSSRMTAEEFGCYWLIILQLYCNEGRCVFDINELKLACSCVKNFEKVWKKIESKFQQKNGQLFHKRVTRELRAAKRFLQDRCNAGVRGAQKRWQSYSKGK